VPETTLETSTVFPGYGYIDAAAEVPPGKIARFFDIIAKITSDLKTRQVSPDELDRARTPRVDLFTKSQQTNGYWLTVLTGAQADPRKLDVIRSTIPDLKHVTAAGVRIAAQTVLVDANAFKLEILPTLAADPAAPKPAEANGLVAVTCTVDADKLTDCRVIREDPPGRGLGGEAIAVAGKLTADAKLGQKDKGGRVTFAIWLPLPDPSN
jgi:hypothetical protein